MHPIQKIILSIFITTLPCAANALFYFHGSFGPTIYIKGIDSQAELKTILSSESMNNISFGLGVSLPLDFRGEVLYTRSWLIGKYDLNGNTVNSISTIQGAVYYDFSEILLIMRPFLGGSVGTSIVHDGLPIMDQLTSLKSLPCWSVGGGLSVDAIVTLSLGYQFTNYHISEDKINPGVHSVYLKLAF